MQSVLMTSPETSPATFELLETQSRRLTALVQRVDAVRHRLPPAHNGVWRGPAHSLYTSSLARLDREIGEALTALEHAAASVGSAVTKSRV